MLCQWPVPTWPTIQAEAQGEAEMFPYRVINGDQTREWILNSDHLTIENEACWRSFLRLIFHVATNCVPKCVSLTGKQILKIELCLAGEICGSLTRSNGGGSPVRSAREPVRASALCCS